VPQKAGNLLINCGYNISFLRRVFPYGVGQLGLTEEYLFVCLPVKLLYLIKSSYSKVIPAELWSKEPEGRNHLEDLGMDGSVKLK
jgi:hypothetical protein